MSSDDSGDKYTDSPNFLDEEGDAMALGYGIGHGFRRIDPRPGKHISTENNPYYYYPGYVVGYVLKALALALLAYAGMQGVA